jgi:hypothetical protein
MNENQVNPNNLLDATDCLEAIGVFRGWKNFLFVIMILSLLLSQTCFWLVNTGYIPASVEEDKINVGVLVRQDESLEGADEDDIPGIGAFVDNVTTSLDEPVETNDMASSLSDDEAESQEETGPLFGMTFKQLSGLLRFVNAILVLMASLYCLTMLFSLKISLLGRLGGINHICRAFFLSLLMLILLLPWQIVFGRLVLGAMYTPDELVSWVGSKSSGFGIILYYLRFCGYWLLILLLLFLSQLRSSRWARAILRRLEII